MSLRFFMYYCAICGAGGAFVGWAFGRFLSWLLSFHQSQESGELLTNSLKGVALGMFIALALSLVDALWVFSFRQIPSIAGRVATAVLVGTMGGLFGGLFGQVLYIFGYWVGETKLVKDLAGPNASYWIGETMKVFGWSLTGLLIGVSLGMFDLIVSVVKGQDARMARKKIINGVVGGGLGGLLGGMLAVVLQALWSGFFKNKPEKFLWSPSAWGFVALGLCIGLLISMAQVIMKEAWVRIEAGVRKGREMIVNKDTMTIGRAESCDIGLFGDPNIEKLHARLLHQGDKYFLEDVGTPAGTYVNDAPIRGPHLLMNGDVIRLGRCVLRFGERAQKN
jgi:hypothetical protein